MGTPYYEICARSHAIYPLLVEPGDCGPPMVVTAKVGKGKG